MAIRAQPVKSLFQRMSRIVREVADATDKQVRLVTHGEATEIDKTVIEQLADPLTHMIRNAVDHGLETSEARAAAGKEVEGTIVLSAAHRSGRVIITVSDDGGGYQPVQGAKDSDFKRPRSGRCDPERCRNRQFAVFCRASPRPVPSPAFLVAASAWML